MEAAPDSQPAGTGALAAHLGLILLCAIFGSHPLWVHGPSCGHDFDFHLQSWLAASAALATRHPWPHWLSAANYGAGEPRFVFYPPLSWLLGGALGRWLPWTLVPQAFTTLAMAGAGAGFYALARSWVRAPLAAAAACVYLCNPYLLFVAYERTAYGELLASGAMPLVVLYAFRASPRSKRLALVLAALWLVNAPSAVMGCYLAAFCGLAAALHARHWAPAGQAAGAIALGTGLAGIYVLPAWYQQRWVEIARVVGPGMRVQDSFLFAHTGEAFHDQVLHTASSLAVAILGLGLLGSAAGWWLARRSSALHTGGEAGLAPAALQRTLTFALAVILLLHLRWSAPLWRLAPELHFLQFPWRWLLVAGVLSGLACAVFAESALTRGSPGFRRINGRLSNARLGKDRLLAGVLCLYALLAGALAEHAFTQPCDDEDNVVAQQALLAPSNAPPGFEGTDEYTPRNAQHGEIQQGLPSARVLPAPDADEGDDTATPNPAWQAPAPASGSIQVEAWQPEDKRLTVTTPAPGFLVLRLMDYPAWQVSLDGRTLPSRPHREDGLLTLPVPGGSSRVRVAWRTTPDIEAGRALSALALALLAGLSLRRRLLRARL